MPRPQFNLQEKIVGAAGAVFLVLGINQYTRHRASAGEVIVPALHTMPADIAGHTVYLPEIISLAIGVFLIGVTLFLARKRNLDH